MFIDYFTTIGGLSTLVLIITEWINRKFNVEKSWVKQLISWCVSILICVVGFVLQLGMFTTFGGIGTWLSWVYVGLTGLGTGLISNGLYDITGVKSLLNGIADWLNGFIKKKTDENKKGDD